MNDPVLDSTPVLVTGGAGFIGSHLVDALLAAGARVRVIDNFSTGKRENLACIDKVEFIEGDIRDQGACRATCDGVVYVFHQAALGSVPRSLEDPATTMAVNVAGTANLLAAARDAKVHRVVYASSSSVYGDSPKVPKREGEEGTPFSPYALSKRVNEELARIFALCFRMELIGLRYFNVYGPRQDPQGPYAAVVPRFLSAYAKGERPVIYGDGEQSRDFTYVADAVAANLLAVRASATACGRAYNVGRGRATSVNELANLVRELAGGGPDPIHLPPRPGDVRCAAADLGDVRRALGFAPTYDLHQGLSETAKHYLSGSGRAPRSGP